MPNQPSRARGAQAGAAIEEGSVETPDQFVRVPASEVQVGDMIVFDQRAKPSEVTSITEEVHNEVSIRRIGGAGIQWMVSADQEIRKVQEGRAH